MTQARLHDPIYGCVSHIFALQQQVVNLQAQLEILKQQAAQSIIYPTGNCSGFGEVFIYPDLEQHLNSFNQDHLKELQSANFGYISFS
ncbi:hypothetical protein HID58_014061 [Brassica napus]|uniref:LOB domain-containing protein n=1 Tax=Brassica napus TaxID=3708 RepID=A0ABQ8DG15_BRANA|nr:hypothetical protein HID58_014061 [Brassica napus]